MSKTKTKEETPVVETPVVETTTDREKLKTFSKQVESTLENVENDKDAFNLIRSLYKQLKKEFVGVKKVKRIKVKSSSNKNKIKTKKKK